MTTNETTTPVTPPAEPRTRGYFNQAQLDDLDQAESVLTAARQNAISLAERDITAQFVDEFEQFVAETRRRASLTGLGSEDAKRATATTHAAAAALFSALQSIQSAAKQKNKMLTADGDPETQFLTDGYLIGTHLDASRAILIQSAETLITRAKADSLPGFKTADKITAVETLLSQFRALESGQQETISLKEITRIHRDDLIRALNVRRSAIQHAADALWPWSDEINRPTRKTFLLPLNRPLGM